MSRVEQRLVAARAGWQRMTAVEAHAVAAAGALLVDTRTDVQRASQGDLPGALVIDRTVLEWRLDPTGADRIAEAVPGVVVIVVCRQGYSSSLAAASLRELGIDATDVIDGVEGWAAAGLPLQCGVEVDERT